MRATFAPGVSPPKSRQLAPLDGSPHIGERRRSISTRVSRQSRESRESRERREQDGDPFDPNTFYAERANAFYDKAVLSFHQAPAPAPENLPAAAPKPSGKNRLRHAVASILYEKKQSLWMQVFSDEVRNYRPWDDSMDDSSDAAWQSCRRRFTMCTLAALKNGGVRSSEEEHKAANSDARRRSDALKKKADAMKMRKKKQEQCQEEKLGSLFPVLWNESVHPTSLAWGGLGWQYDINDDDLRPAWDDGVAAAAYRFDERHAKFSSDMKRLLSVESTPALHLNTEVSQRSMDICLFKLKHRLCLQPLRLAGNTVSPGTSSTHGAQETFKMQLALTSGKGGPLMPVYARTLASDVMEEEEPPPPAPVRREPWSLFGSIWGPRSESCDGQDFFDHEDVIFERFCSDWQRILRLGAYKMVMDSDDDPIADEDNDGVADEVEDLGAVLFAYSQLCSLAWCWYADAIYSGGADLTTGVKKELGWKAISDDCNFWDDMNEADKASKNTMIFMGVDKTDKVSAAAIVIQASTRGRRARKAAAGQRDSALFSPRDMEAAREEEVKDALLAQTKDAIDKATDKSQAFTAKQDNQLSRAEFVSAIVKTAIERFVKTKRTPKNEIDDVSDGVEKLFRELLQPALAQPLPGCSQPKLPLPDTFREEHCYKEAMTDVLDRHAPSLRVLFACLAKVSFERSRSCPPTLPKPTRNRQVKRGRSQWIVVPGFVTYEMWTLLITRGLQFKGPKGRDLSLCFIYSIMCVIDGQSDEGQVKERHLSFEDFLETLVRLAALVALPTDDMLAAAEITHAGAFLESVDVGTMDALIQAQQVEWGSAPDPTTAGEMPRRVDHLIDLILRKIKPPKGDHDAPLEKLTRREVRTWALRTLGAREHELADSWTKEKHMGED